MELAETGLGRQIVKMLPWIPKADKCFAEISRKSAKQTSIKLEDLTSVFLILGLGVAATVLAFLVELTVFYSAKKRGTLRSTTNLSRVVVYG